MLKRLVVVRKVEVRVNFFPILEYDDIVPNPSSAVIQRRMEIDSRWWSLLLFRIGSSVSSSTTMDPYLNGNLGRCCCEDCMALGLLPRRKLKR